MLRTQSITAGVASLLVVVAMLSVPAAASDTQVTGGIDGTPEWVVHVTDGGLDTLESWANSSDDRRVLRMHNASNTATIRAPPSAVGAGTLDRLLGATLTERSYVTALHPSYQHNYADPVRLENQSAIEAPSRTTRVFAGASSPGSEWSPSGIAYAEDANRSTLADVRDVTGADNVSATGTGQTIAVIDSGVNTANGRVFGNGTSGSQTRILNASKDFISNETVKADGLDAVEDPGTNHGTWVAAAAAANHSDSRFDGMAPSADILALRTLDSEGQGSTSDIATAVRYAADNGADTIVMSLGSPVYDQELTSALEYAVEHNVSAIAIAAGNSRQTVRWVASPADAPVDGVTTVAATNTTANATAGSAYFSQIGPDPGTSDLSGGKTAGEDISVAAPGMNVVAKVPTSSGSVVNSTKSGTSMAAPVVAGGATAALSTNPSWAGDAVAFDAAVTDSARPMPQAAQAEVGGGLFAADRLVNNETTGSQADAMTEEAEARSEFWAGVSETGQAIPGWGLVSG
ncbi:S8 family serine peptidase [Halomicroarcula sp. S1AR25-4]|uniref:S8 family peptidase n=1 Tax=Haloarcula sp. S1AR25-4 TaxID=2950538 RepID=UPI002874E8AA|nr:S8 family serine peptidase [Halomicroarcula sp. S1AR25-4]MDS0279997.1 S8 family serine peptidase [Halomicroarcula sp. S1AR25-4]